ncbi:MAG: dihydroorotase [Erysipelotrichaceae bacterium]
MLIKNAKVWKDNSFQDIDVVIKDGVFHAFGEGLSADEVIDAKGCALLPGLIDVHVHLREPGNTKKETIHTGTMAALAGGFTTVAAMPNTNPVPDCSEVVVPYLTLLAEHAHCHVLAYGALTKGLNGKELVDYAALKQYGIQIFSDDGKGVQMGEAMRDVMQQAKAADVMVVAHLEDEAVLKAGACVHEGIIDKRLGLVGMSGRSEYEQMERDLALVREWKTDYHACHLSCKESVALLAQAKAENLPVSGEVCIHHLLLNEEDVLGTNWKMNPPLRSKEDQAALLASLQTGVMDMIVSDHAPHTQLEKSLPMEQAPFGIVGLETNFPLAYTYLVKTGMITMERLMALMSENPAKRFGCKNKGRIELGYVADCFLVDLEKEITIDKEAFLSMGKNTPFDGWKVFGDVQTTLVEGKVGYSK